MDLASRIDAIIEPTVEDMGYTLVRTRVRGARRMQVQVMAERTNGSGMDVEDCARLSRAISALLDVEDPITGTYTLEVSSPGIDRPLITPQDFERFVGFDARVEAGCPIDGRRRFTGAIKSVADGMVTIITEDGEFAVPLDRIAQAKLLLTDELIAAASDKGLS